MDKIEALERARQARRDRGETGLRSPIEKAQANPRSRSLAIYAKCYDCEGQDADPGWRWRIGNCQIVECPLWRFRPYQQFGGRPMPDALRVKVRKSRGNNTGKTQTDEDDPADCGEGQ